MRNVVSGIVWILSALLFLGGCSEGKFVEEAKKTEQRNNVAKKENDLQIMYYADQEKEIYKKMERPAEEAVESNELDKKSVIDDATDVKKLENYTDGDEFAKFVAKILYEFYTLKLSPQEYYDFMIHYGSKEILNELPSKEDAISIYESLQNSLKQKNMHGEEYVISEVTYDRLKNEAYFYRKVISTNGVEYYITNLVKEGEYWKFIDDSPSPPFEEKVNGQTKDEERSE